MSATVSAQVQSESLWALNLPDTTVRGGEVVIKDQIVDPSGNFYVAGIFEYTALFDLNPDSTKRDMTAGGEEAFIAKYDTAWKLIWMKALRGKEVILEGLALDSSNNLYATGYFEGRLDVDIQDSSREMIYSMGEADGFLAKYDSAGMLLWAQQIGGFEQDLIRTVAVGVDQQPVIAGLLIDSAKFDRLNPHSSFIKGRNGLYSLFLAKYEPDGESEWVKIIKGIARPYGIGIDANLNISVTGMFFARVDFDPSPSSSFNRSPVGNDDIFIASYDSSGAFRWANVAGSSAWSEFGMDIAIGPKQSVWAIGEYYNTIDFDSSSSRGRHSSSGSSDVFVWAMDSAGKYMNSMSLGGRGSNQGNAIAFKNDSTFAIVGSFFRNMQFDPNNTSTNRSSQGGRDAYLALYDTSLSYRWDVVWGDSSPQVAVAESHALSYHPLQGFLVTGQLQDKVDMDPSAGKLELEVPHDDQNGFVTSFRDSARFQKAGLIGRVPDVHGPAYSAAVEDVVVDAARNSYIIGTYSSVLDMNPLDTAVLISPGIIGGSTEMFLAKYDSSGILQWALTSSGVNSTTGNAICLDSFGNVYITGSYHGTVDFDTKSSAGSMTTNFLSNNTFIAKYGTDGTLKWVKGLRSHLSGVSRGWNKGEDIICDGDGNPILCGLFRDRVDFDPSSNQRNLSSRGQDDHYILKLDSSGAYQWAHRFGSSSWEYQGHLGLDDSGSVYWAGEFQSSATFSNPADTLVSKGNRDIFLAKYSAGGQRQFANIIGGSSNDYVYALTVNHKGWPLLSGTIAGKVDFDPSPDSAFLNAGKARMYLANYNDSGHYQFARVYGASVSSMLPTSMSLGDTGDIFVGGWFVGDIELSDTLGHAPAEGIGGPDACIGLYDSIGNYKNHWLFAGYDEDLPNAIVQAQGEIWLGGSIKGIVDVDPSDDIRYLSASNSADPFLLSFAHCSSSEDQYIFACDSAMVDSTMYYESSRVVLTYENVYGDGCDSVVRVFLTITPTHYSREIAACDSFVLDSVTYYKSQTVLDTFKRNSACDSILETRLTIRSSAVRVDSLIACRKVSLFGSTYDSSGWVIHRVKGAASSGCDSVYRTYLDIRKAQIDSQYLRGCDSGFFDGRWYDSSVILRDTLILPASNGCDSIRITELDVRKSSNSKLQVRACDSFIFYGRSYDSSQTLYDTLRNAMGCDSMVEMELLVHRTQRVSMREVACDSFVRPDSTYYQSTIIHDTLISSKGCDSILMIQLRVNGTMRTFDTMQGCGYLDYKGKRYTASVNLVEHVVQGAQSGCDSFHYQRLHVLPYGRDTIRRLACDSMIHQGQSIYATTIFRDTIIAASLNGCDSMVLTEVSIRSSSTFQWVQEVCDSFDYRGVWYKHSRLFYDTLVNHLGCDSLRIFDLRINQTRRDSFAFQACDSIRYQGQWYRSSVQLLDTFTDATPADCDSIVFTDIEIAKSSSAFWAPFSCDSFRYKGKVYKQSLKWVDTLTNAQGCDSLLEIELTIQPTFRDTSFHKGCDSVIYNGQVYRQSVILGDTVRNGRCDSIWIQAIIVHTSKLVQIDTSIAKGDTFRFGSKIYTQAGNYRDTIYSDSCYAVLVLNLKWKTSSVFETNAALGFELFPNPTRGAITIRSNRLVKLIELEDAKGRRVYYTEGTPFRNKRIKLSLPSGQYFYRAVLENGEIYSGKLLLIR